MAGAAAGAAAGAVDSWDAGMVAVATDFWADGAVAEALVVLALRDFRPESLTNPGVSVAVACGASFRLGSVSTSWPFLPKVGLKVGSSDCDSAVCKAAFPVEAEAPLSSSDKSGNAYRGNRFQQRPCYGQHRG